jgi:2'-5' RNA ligase
LSDQKGQSIKPHSAQTMRVFFAFDLTQSTKANLNKLIDELRSRDHGDRVRWVRVENLHVTLHFIGNVSPDSVPRLLHAVSQELVRERPIATQLTALHLFPSEKRPHVIALGLESDESLKRLAEAVKRGVSAVGMPSDKRPFKPHLTLGRIRGNIFPSIRDMTFDGNAKIKVREVLLYQSELYPDGPLYRERGKIILGAGEG